MTFSGKDAACPGSRDSKYVLKVTVECDLDLDKLEYEKVTGTMCWPEVFFKSPKACPIFEFSAVS